MKIIAQIAFAVFLSLIIGCNRSEQPAPPRAIARPIDTPSTVIYPPNAHYIRGDDSAAIATHPDMVRREGSSLLLFVSGKPVARTHVVNDDLRTEGCEAPGICFDWEFAGLVRLKDASGTLTAMPVIRSYTWGETIYVVIDPAGRNQWLTSSPLASPDGCYLSSGRRPYIEHPGELRVIDWCNGYTHKEYYASAPCKPSQWVAFDTLLLLCGEATDEQEFPATAKRQSNGTWLITPPAAHPDMINRKERAMQPWYAKWPDHQYGIEILHP